MISSTGKYYPALDHIRAVAAFLVFTWHFIHVHDGQLASPPLFPLSLLSEGHTGVALFMTLSGYLFARLLDGRQINYASFIWNRFFRLAPLLIFITLALGLRDYASSEGLIHFFQGLANGDFRPSLPNGLWSIIVEFNFYLLLPLLLMISRKWTYGLPFLVAAFILARSILYAQLGEIQWLSYWTIVGRIDQFLLGMIAFQFRQHITGKHFRVFCIFVLFLVIYAMFDAMGGFYDNIAYPSPSPIWIWLPALEGIAYASVIAWYDNSFKHSSGPVSRFIANIGTYSYSIYLLHFYLVFTLATTIDTYLLDLSSIYISMLIAPFAFLLMVPLGYLSFRYIESPFLKFRISYIRPLLGAKAISPVKELA